MTLQKLGRALLLVALLLQLASGQDESITITISDDTETVSRTITPPPTTTATDTATKSATADVSLSASASFELSLSTSASKIPPPCRVQTTVANVHPMGVAFSDIPGAPDALLDSVFACYEVSSVEFQQRGITIAQLLDDGIFDYAGRDARQMMTVTSRDRIFYGALGPAESLAPTSEYPSLEGHGINEYTDSGRLEVNVIRGQNVLAFTVEPIPVYRIATDEWIFFNFYSNNTIPAECASETIAVHVTAFHRGLLFSMCQGVCFTATVVGIVAGTLGSSITSSYHAGMVAVVSGMHYAQEDGVPLSVALNPAQWTAGDGKYRYVRGALYVNSLIIGAVFLAQTAVVGYCRALRGQTRSHPKALTAFPRI